jgi:hypothetical protein
MNITGHTLITATLLLKCFLSCIIIRFNNNNNNNNNTSWVKWFVVWLQVLYIRIILSVFNECSLSTKIDILILFVRYFTNLQPQFCSAEIPKQSLMQQLATVFEYRENRSNGMIYRQLVVNITMYVIFTVNNGMISKVACACLYCSIST